MSTENTELKPVELLKKELPELQAIMQLNATKDTDVETLAKQELEYLRMQALTKPEIMECMPQTILMAVKSVLKQNLSLDPYAGLVYIKTRNVKVGEGNWKKALEIQPTCNGILSIAYQCGKIIDHKNPEVFKDDSGKVIRVDFEYQVGSGRWEKRSFDESDFYRWRRASHKENGRNKQDANAESLNYANENYTNWKGGVDPEFSRAKAIRHSLKKRGTNPNEGKFEKIVATPKQVIIDPEKDIAAGSDTEFQQAEVISSELNAANDYKTDL